MEKKFFDELVDLLSDKKERNELLGGLFSVIMFVAICFLLMAVFQSDGLLSLVK